MSEFFNEPFPGSYSPRDCLFLLKPITPIHTPIEEKERLIQSGLRHYSEMVTWEEPPSAAYQQLFLALTAHHRARLAQDILNLADSIRRVRSAPITLLSLARAGTPIGALLRRALNDFLGIESEHYSISIIRDRGIDERALQYLLERLHRPAAGLVFVDGWTAKGVIAQELKRAITSWNQRCLPTLPEQLFVVADIGGVADVAATHDDYLIPSGIMNATVSGLVSRSVLNDQISPGDFHGCLVYQHLQPHDRSAWFLDQITQAMVDLEPGPVASAVSRIRQAATTQDFLQSLQDRYGVSDRNRIKPGIAEATRVMLRRVPDLLLLKNASSPDVAHLQMLAQEKNIPIYQESLMPWNAVALIRDVRRPGVY